MQDKRTSKNLAKVAPETSSSPARVFPVVGVGASAGGLEAFEQFFRHMPSDSGMAFVLIPHLDPSHHSILTEILQRATAMPVAEAIDQIQVLANHVYVIPPNRDMAIFHGKLQLNVPDEPRGQRMPIDAFLRSLAEDQGENAIGMILSGTGTDGTLGLRAIVGSGGMSLVQEPASAKYDGMPNSAIQAGYANHILPVEKMAEVMISSVRIQKHHHETPVAPSAASGMAHILMQLRTLTGHDFSLYKKSTITRRIERRMSQQNIEDTEVYARYLKENPAEVHTLFKELLINVTSFFRDKEAFTELKNVLQQQIKDIPQDYVFRVWVTGCATGEEAYSIAILLREHMEESQQHFKVQIYSTDLDDDVIAIARMGLYSPNIVQDISPERLRRFFHKEANGYRVKKEIREMVVFATQNVTKDPPFTKLDLLSCRNLMIYLEPELQNRLILAFHYALKPGGVLFLSPAESIGNHENLFSPLNRKWKLYRAIHTASSSRALMIGPLGWAASNSGKTSEVPMKKTKEELNFAELTRRALVQFYAPASVITDFSGNIRYVHGDTGKYLRPAPGQASLNIAEMAREGLELTLRAAIHAATNQKTPTLNQEVLIKTSNGHTAVGLSVRPLPDTEEGQNLLLISFQDMQGTHLRLKSKRAGKSDELGRIQHLERELAYTKENLQATIDEQQSSNEELMSANEELQSTNEELQSTNEEMETSKEELQSVNEELITVNAELQDKIEQLSGMQNDMKNLLDNINIGTVFLDVNLIIRRFTRDAVNLYRLVPSDVGRSLADIKSEIETKDLLPEAQTVLDTLVQFEHEVRTRNGTSYLARIQPYRTMDNVIEGVVLTFTDISRRIRAEIAERQAREMAENIVDTVREPLLVLNGHLQVMSANRAFYQFFQASAPDTLGKKIYDLGNRQWDIPALRELLDTILPREQTFESYVVEHDFPAIGRRKMMLNARSMASQADGPDLILLAMEDIT